MPGSILTSIHRCSIFMPKRSSSRLQLPEHPAVSVRKPLSNFTEPESIHLIPARASTGWLPNRRRACEFRVLQPSQGTNQPPASFPATVEFTPHTTYFSALITSDGNNFFGPLVSTTPVGETIQTPNLDLTSTDPAKIEVVLQGIVLGYPHDVAIALNGSTLGDLTFTGQDKGTFSMTLPPGLLQNGANTVTLTAENGEYDTSLLQSIRSYVSSFLRCRFRLAAICLSRGRRSER